MVIVEGREFSREFASDSVNSIIIYQTMASGLGLDKPMGKQLDNNYQQWTIVGIVEDFHFKSLKENITSLAFTLGNDTESVALTNGINQCCNPESQIRYSVQSGDDRIDNMIFGGKYRYFYG